MASVRAILAMTLVNLSFLAAQQSACGQETRLGFNSITAERAQEILKLEPTPLPSWALILAEPLPNSTVALLRLDSLQRSANPLGNVLAAKIRWVVADTLHCDFQLSYAEADLSRLGVDRLEIKEFQALGDALDQDEREVAAFARRLTEAAYSVTDEEVAELVNRYGAAKVVGIVHTVAFANFQCRLIQGLQCELGDAEPLPPIDSDIDSANPNELRTGHRPEFPTTVEDKYLARVTLPTEWNQFDSTRIDQGLAAQQSRPGRVPIPKDDQLQHLTSVELQRTGRVIWSRVSLGYQPELTRAWFRLMNAFHTDSEMDQLFCNSMFLVVTRSNECFY